MMTTQQKIWHGGETLWRSFRPILAYIFLPGILMMIGMLIRRYPGTVAEFSAESGNFYNFLGFALILGYFYKNSRKRGESFWNDITLSFSKDKKNLRFMLLCFLFGMSVSMLVSSLLTVIPLPFGLSEAYEAKSMKLFAGRDILLLVLSMVFFAPVAEEILFRGYMLNRLLTFFSVKTSVWICSLAFAICHANLIWMMYALCMGLFLALLSVKQDNVLFSICVHMGFNTPSVMIAMLERTQISRLLFGQGILIVMYGVIGAAAGRLIYIQMIREENYDED